MTITQPVYLDYNATTPLDSRVFESMQEWFCGPPSNAGSRTHPYGQRARDAVEVARQQVADCLGAAPDEVVFTSGATESNNIAILGIAEFGERTERKHILSTTIEHKAILEPLNRMSQLGFEVEVLPVTQGGSVDVETIRKSLRNDTLLVSVMHANNETGVLQPVHEIAELLDGTDTLFHTDAAQTFGKETEELKTLPCDFISISSHKIYGPQGVGALYVRRRGAARRPLDSLIFGGGQERGLRPGTIPVPLVVGFGQAVGLAMSEYQDRATEANRVKDQLIAGLQSVDHEINGDQTMAQPHVLNVCFPGVDSEALMMALRDKIAISNGSACTSASYDPSHVLLAMGLDEDRISESVRISWGAGVSEIPVKLIVSAVESLCIRF
jgi:cysteine desulfurase